MTNTFQELKDLPRSNVSLISAKVYIPLSLIPSE